MEKIIKEINFIGEIILHNSFEKIFYSNHTESKITLIEIHEEYVETNQYNIHWEIPGLPPY
jgi:hypothetical protein